MASRRSPALGSQVGPWPPRPLRNRPWAALGALLAALEPVFWRSWRVLGPFSGGSPASGGSRGSSGRPFLDGYCGGGAQEPGKSTNVVDFRYLGEQVVALMFGLFFLPCDAASGEGKFENQQNPWVFVGRNACARFSRTTRRTDISDQTSTENSEQNATKT